jgi:hypothetical protein
MNNYCSNQNKISIFVSLFIFLPEYENEINNYVKHHLMKSKISVLKEGNICNVVAGTHIRKSGTVKDINLSKTGHITITVEQKNGVRFKTLGKNVVVKTGETTLKKQQAIHKDIIEYNKSQSLKEKEICTALAKLIHDSLPNAENKIWHAHPVWFIDGNPIVGYSKLKTCIRLLFWSGQSFEEATLQNEGSFKAAEMRYTSTEQIVAKDLKRWLK